MTWSSTGSVMWTSSRATSCATWRGERPRPGRVFESAVPQNAGAVGGSQHPALKGELEGLLLLVRDAEGVGSTRFGGSSSPESSVVYDEVPFVSWGQYVQPVVFKRKVRGALKFAAPVVGRVWMDA